MSALPSGTLTFLFTDIEGSTALLKRLGERYAAVLAEHQRILRQTFTQAGGQEVDTQGDAFFIVFTRAKDALGAAVAAQRALAAHPWPDQARVRVRMGLHSGEPTLTGQHYIGLGVHRAARICSAATGGQILLSATTRALLADEPQPELELHDLGERELKDLDHPEHLYEVIAAGMADVGNAPQRPALRLVIADDSVLLREGIARLLTDAGFEIAAMATDADELIRCVETERPAVAITDIRMPPTNTDEGLIAAERIRTEFPETGVLILSQYLESRYAARLLEHFPERVGYLLKERVSDVAVLTDAIRRVAEGECVLDPTIVSRLMQRARAGGPLEHLNEQELELLGLIAEGHPDEAIAERLGLDHKQIKAQTTAIFERLGLSGTADDLRRTSSVLNVLRA
jgi:class 3 adenylate cyclase/DNA-binding NarL/FixJ family response regulator